MAKRKRDVETHREVNVVELFRKYESHKSTGLVARLLWHNLELCVSYLPERSWPKGRSKKAQSIIDRDIRVKEGEASSVQRLKHAISGAKQYAATGELEKFCICIVDIALFVPDDVRKTMNWVPPALGKIIMPTVEVLQGHSVNMTPCINPHNTEEFLAGNAPHKDLVLLAWDKLLAWSPPMFTPRKGMPGPKEVVPTIPICEDCEGDSSETRLKRELGLESYKSEGCRRHNRVEQFRNKANKVVIDYIAEQQKNPPTSSEQQGPTGETGRLLAEARPTNPFPYELRKRRKLTNTLKPLDGANPTNEKGDEDMKFDLEAQIQVLDEHVSSLLPFDGAGSRDTDVVIEPSVNSHSSPVVSGEEHRPLQSVIPLEAPPVADTGTATTARIGSLRHQSALNVNLHQEESLHRELEFLRAKNDENEKIISKFMQAIATYGNVDTQFKSEITHLRADLISEISEQVSKQVSIKYQDLPRTSDDLKNLQDDMKGLRAVLDAKREISNPNFNDLNDDLGKIRKQLSDHDNTLKAVDRDLKTADHNKSEEIKRLETLMEQRNLELSGLQVSVKDNSSKVQTMKTTMNRIEGTVKAQEVSTKTSIAEIQDRMKAIEEKTDHRLSESRNQISDLQRTEKESKDRLDKLSEEYTSINTDLQKMKSKVEGLQTRETALFSQGRSEEGRKDSPMAEFLKPENMVTLRQSIVDRHVSQIAALEPNMNPSDKLRHELNETSAAIQSLEKRREEDVETLRAEIRAKLATNIAEKTSMENKLDTRLGYITTGLEGLAKITENAKTVAQESMSATSSLQDALDDFTFKTSLMSNQQGNGQGDLTTDIQEIRNETNKIQAQLDSSEQRISSLEDQLRAKSATMNTEKLLMEERNEKLCKVEGIIKDITSQLGKLEKTTKAHGGRIEGFHTKIESTLEGIYGTKPEQASSQIDKRIENPNRAGVTQEPLAARIRSLEQGMMKMKEERDETDLTETRNSLTLLQNNLSKQQSGMTELKGTTGIYGKDIEDFKNKFSAMEVKMQTHETSLQDEVKLRMAEVRNKLGGELTAARDTMENELKTKFGAVISNSDALDKMMKDATKALAQIKETAQQAKSEAKSQQEELKKCHLDESSILEQQNRERKRKHDSLTREIEGVAADTKKLRRDLSTSQAIVEEFQCWLHTKRTSADTEQLLHRDEKTRLLEIENIMKDVKAQVRGLHSKNTAQGSQIERLQTQIKTVLGEEYETKNENEATHQSGERQKNTTKPEKTTKSLVARIYSLENAVVKIELETNKTKERVNESQSSLNQLSSSMTSLRDDVNAKHDNLESELHGTTNSLDDLTEKFRDHFATIEQLRKDVLKLKTERNSGKGLGIDKTTQTELCDGGKHEKTVAQTGHAGKATQAKPNDIDLSRRLREKSDEVERLNHQLRGDEASRAKFVKEVSEYITKKRRENGNLKFELELARLQISSMNEILSSRDARFEELQNKLALASCELRRLETERGRKIGGAQRLAKNDAALPDAESAISGPHHHPNRSSTDKLQASGGKSGLVKQVDDLGSKLHPKSKQPVPPEKSGLLASIGTTLTESGKPTRDERKTFEAQSDSYHNATKRRTKPREQLQSTPDANRLKLHDDCWHIESITSNNSGSNHSVILKHSNGGKERVLLKKLLALDKNGLVERLREQWTQHSDKDGKSLQNAPPCLRIIRIDTVDARSEKKKYKVIYVDNKVGYVEQTRLLGWGYHVLAMVKAADTDAGGLEKTFDEDFWSRYNQPWRDFSSKYANICLL